LEQADDKLGSILKSIVDLPILKPDGHNKEEWTPSSDYQAQSDGSDLNICVTASADNGYEYPSTKLFLEDDECTEWFRNNGYVDENGKIKYNNRIVAVGSDTDPNNGNSVTTVVEFIRTHGLAPQSASPWDNTWSKGQFYRPLTETELNAGKLIFMMFDLAHAWLPTSIPVWSNTHTPVQLIEGLKRGWPTLSVDGYYEQDNDGLISARTTKIGRKTFMNYTHRVTLQDYELKLGITLEQLYKMTPAQQSNALKRFIVHDHYTRQIISFRPDYLFGNAKLETITKKPLGGTFAKLENSPEIFMYGAGGKYKNELIGFENGDVLKSIVGEYVNANPRLMLKVRPLNTKTLFIK